MSKKEPEEFQETTVDGPRTKRWALESKDCPELRTHRIARMGWEEAFSPYRRIRLQPTGSFFLATTEGEGRILLDGKWQRVTAGTLFMAPPRVLNAFYAVTARKWAFAWIRYEELPFIRPMVGAESPVRAVGGGMELARCIAGLQVEWTAARDPRVLHHWISLVQSFAERAAQPMAVDDKLAALWEKVGASLNRTWTLDDLAAEIHASPEALRRRCLREMGRSPVHHVTYMRMQRAQALLESTKDKLDVIAQRVGFTDGMTFARAFKRWIGRTPGEYRQR
jgi:AraC-like DNA-binding protein